MVELKIVSKAKGELIVKDLFTLSLNLLFCFPLKHFVPHLIPLFHPLPYLVSKHTLTLKFFSKIILVKV